MRQPLREVRIEELSVFDPSGRARLEKVSFRVLAGRPLGILGSSGAGKSLTLAALVGMTPPRLRAQGTLVLSFGDERQSIEFSDRRSLARLRGRVLATIPQAATASLNPVLTVGAQLRELRHRHGTDLSPSEALQRVGLEQDHLDRFPSELSGGMAQRVLIAMALLCNAAGLLADEASASLDPPAAMALNQLLFALARQAGSLMVTASHDLATLASGCDDLIVISEGRLVERYADKQMLTQPGPHAAKFLAAARRAGEAIT